MACAERTSSTEWESVSNELTRMTVQSDEIRLGLAQQGPSRRQFLTDVGRLGAVAVFGSSPAQNLLRRVGSCPQVKGRRIRWIVPYSPGGGYDIYSRLIEPFYEQRVDAEIVIDNVAGAGGAVGARTLKESKPNGLTMGILAAPGFLVTAMIGQTRTPNPATDFTILGRVAQIEQLWFTGRQSPLRTMDDLLREARNRPIVFAITEVAGLNFVNVAVISSLMDINAEYVAGFAGSREASLAVARGDVDVACFNFDSVRDRIETGDLRPLLQIGREPIASHPSLRGIPVFGGESGWVVQLAREHGRNRDETREMASALLNISRAGRLIAGPPGLGADLVQCLDHRLHEVLTDPAFEAAAAKASRSLDPARANVATTDVRAATASVDTLLPVVRDAVRHLRG